MTTSHKYQNRIELLQGTLDLLILQTLQWGPRHGYGITHAIRANSSEALQVDTGSLYPALHRLERQKLIAASWKVSENKQRTRVSPDRGGPAAARVRTIQVGPSRRGDGRHPQCRAAGGSVMSRKDRELQEE